MGNCSSVPYRQEGRTKFVSRGDKIIYRPPFSNPQPIDKNALVLQREGDPYLFDGVEMVTFSGMFEEVVLLI
jgi:hypothetical protein